MWTDPTLIIVWLWYKSRRIVPCLSLTRLYICGPTNLVDQSKIKLVRRAAQVTILKARHPVTLCWNISGPVCSYFIPQHRFPFVRRLWTESLRSSTGLEHVAQETLNRHATNGLTKKQFLDRLRVHHSQRW